MSKKLLELALHNINRTIEFIDDPKVEITTMFDVLRILVDKTGGNMAGIYQAREILKAELEKLKSRKTAGKNGKLK